MGIPPHRVAEWPMSKRRLPHVTAIFLLESPIIDGWTLLSGMEKKPKPQSVGSSFTVVGMCSCFSPLFIVVWGGCRKKAELVATPRVVKEETALLGCSSLPSPLSDAARTGSPKQAPGLVQGLDGALWTNGSTVTALPGGQPAAQRGLGDLRPALFVYICCLLCF